MGHAGTQPSTLRTEQEWVSGLQCREGHFFPPALSTGLVLSYDVCVFLSCTHPMKLHILSHMSHRNTHTQTCMLHTPAFRPRGKHTNKVQLCTHCAHTRTCSHMPPFRHILTHLSTPAGLKKIHTDIHICSHRPPQTSAHTLIHTAAPMPKHMQLTCACTAVQAQDSCTHTDTWGSAICTLCINRYSHMPI